MSIQVIWSPEREEEFIRLADLTGADAEIIRMRHHRNGMMSDLYELKKKGYFMCQESYYDRVEELKHKYDLAQLRSNILPRRMPNKRLAKLESDRLITIMLTQNDTKMMGN